MFDRESGRWTTSTCKEASLYSPLSYPLTYYMLEQLKFVEKTRVHHMRNKVSAQSEHIWYRHSLFVK